MKILQINVVYKTGSTGKIMYDIHSELLKNGFESSVCYSRSMKPDNENEHRLCGKFYSHCNGIKRRITGNMYGCCFFSTKKCISIIKKEKPDVVHLHCLNGDFINIYRLINYLKKDKIITILTLHAEFMYTGGCGYSYDCIKWKNELCKKCPRFKEESHSILFNKMHSNLIKMNSAFEDFDNLTIVGVSDWIANRANLSSTFQKMNVLRIHNGINLDVFHCYSAEEKEKIKVKYHIPCNKKIVLSVNPRFHDPVKGGIFLKEIAQKLPNEYKVVLVGHREETDDFISIPYTENQSDLAKLYSCASVYIHTSIIDNYPTVCIEANCCGTPVIGFNVGGVKETIGDGMGAVVDNGDISKMIIMIKYWSNISLSSDAIEKRRLYCDKLRMAQDYITLYKQCCDKK